MEPTLKPPEVSTLDPARIVDLDVRAALRAGEEPFQEIMRARHALAEDGVLRLRAIFEPRPLYEVMGREGFGHWTERLADDDWRVWFFRAPGSAGGPAGPGGGARPGATGDGGVPAEGPDRPPLREDLEAAPSDVRVLDVRGLEPPEPMVRTLEALENLPAGHTLVQLNVRVPRFLLPELERRGFAWTVREEGRDRVRTAIRRTP